MHNPGKVLLNDFKSQWVKTRKATLGAIERVGENGWYILGPELLEFEKDLAQYWGLPHAAGCANGMDAIEISLRCLGLQPGERVLTTPLSAFASSLAVIRAGGKPVFVDTDASGHLDLRLAEKIFDAHRDIRFMIPVHLFGHATSLADLERLKNRFDLKIVEDCAQAIGAKSRGRVVGSIGQMAATSFYPTKNLGALGDSGAILTANPEMDRHARYLRDYGQAEKYMHEHLGMNSRLDELHAAIMRDALLPEVSGATVRRQKIARFYRAEIRNARIELPPIPEGSESVWHLFPVLIAGTPSDRVSFEKHLDRTAIGWGRHYPRLIPDQDSLRTRVPALHETLSPLTNALRFANQEVSLPIHPYLSDEEVQRVIVACNEWKP